MYVFLIRTNADHQRALKEIEPFFDNPPPDDDPVWASVDLMAERIESYEKRHFPASRRPMSLSFFWTRRR